VQYIEDLKKKMMQESGAEKIDEAFINDHSSKVATMMIDPNSPIGKEFEDRLNDYIKQLNQITGESFATLAKAPKDIDVFAEDEDHARKSFLEFTFENTPAIAALTSVTQIQTEILEYESSALRKFAEEVGAAQVSFESIIPMVRPVSSVVAAGAPYEADMFISASSSSLSPEMSYNGKTIPVELDPVTGIKMGKVKFNATASVGKSNEDPGDLQPWSVQKLLHIVNS
jgi:gliding motility-associated protein GldM